MEQNIYSKGMEYLIGVVQQLSLAKTLEEVVEITRHAARELTGADGAAFVLRDVDRCYYVDEDAIGPLWKGKKFPMSTCISGWAMMNKQSVAIADITLDSRIPQDAYRPTFVKSLLMVPIRTEQPIGAIGNYWAVPHLATPEQIKLLEALAASTSIALENVKLYTDLKEANEFLADSLQARDEFFSIASHEFRTPITAIKMQLQMTERKLKNHVTTEFANLQISMQEVNRLEVLVEQLLDVSQIRLGKVTISPTSTDCSKFIKELMMIHTANLEKAKCTVDLHIEEGIVAEWDCQKVVQILNNLVTNIVNHAPGSRVQISLYKKEEGQISLLVQDSGPGISREVQEILFKRFERAHSPRKLGGIGLGLYIAKSLTEAHGGQMLLVSNPSNGTTFEILLPVMQL